ncbi:MAG: ribonuclease III [Bacteroidales bacterium]|nr:ribonuclease III [Bacteroidales bacterium]MCL2738193.1 ribonuclease III [Bacteroidales bacterium]
MRRLRVPKVRSIKSTTREQALLKRLKKCLGYTPRNVSLYTLSLVHKSAVKEYRACNERLEFLGDAILNSVVSEVLYFQYPNHDEGFLTQMRSKVVNRASLNALAQKTGLCAWVQIRAPQKAGNNRNVLGDMLEALVGAIYLDRGYATCRKVIINKLLSSVNWEELAFTETDYKSRVIERCQRLRLSVAFQTKQVLEEHSGNPKFVSQLLIDTTTTGSGQGASKKEAEQAAAQQAWNTVIMEMPQSDIFCSKP